MISALPSQTHKIGLVCQQWPNYKIVKLASNPFLKIWCWCDGKNFWSNVYLTEIWFYRFDRRLSQNRNRRFYAEKKICTLWAWTSDGRGVRWLEWLWNEGCWVTVTVTHPGRQARVSISLKARTEFFCVRLFFQPGCCCCRRWWETEL